MRSMRGAYPDGHAIPPHAHDWHQLIYADSGIMTVSANMGLWVVPPQWAIWAPAGIEHAIRFSGASSFATLYLRPDHWDDLPATSTAIAVSPLLRELIRHACDIGMLDRRNRLQEATALLIVDSLRTKEALALGLPMPASEDLRRVAEHCRDTREDAGIAELAACFGIGARTLERRFAVETGMTLGAWRRHARFLLALRLLARGVPVKAVASDAGYRSQSAFVAAFRETFATTPGRYFGVRD